MLIWSHAENTAYDVRFNALMAVEESVHFNNNHAFESEVKTYRYKAIL